MRRAKAAAERLCILAGDEFPWERRDASVLLWHTGQVSQAAAELEAYEGSTYYRINAKAPEKSLVERLLARMHSHPGMLSCTTLTCRQGCMCNKGCLGFSRFSGKELVQAGTTQGILILIQILSTSACWMVQRSRGVEFNLECGLQFETSLQRRTLTFL